jgi:hypothetical protein
MGYKHTYVGKESEELKKWWNRWKRGEEWPVWWLIWDICWGRGEACFAGGVNLAKVAGASRPITDQRNQ